MMLEKSLERRFSDLNSNKDENGRQKYRMNAVIHLGGGGGCFKKRDYVDGIIVEETNVQ